MSQPFKHTYNLYTFTDNMITLILLHCGHVAIAAEWPLWRQWPNEDLAVPALQSGTEREIQTGIQADIHTGTLIDRHMCDNIIHILRQ